MEDGDVPLNLFVEREQLSALDLRMPLHQLPTSCNYLNTKKTIAIDDPSMDMFAQADVAHEVDCGAWCMSEDASDDQPTPLARTVEETPEERKARRQRLFTAAWEKAAVCRRQNAEDVKKHPSHSPRSKTQVDVANETWRRVRAWRRQTAGDHTKYHPPKILHKRRTSHFDNALFYGDAWNSMFEDMYAEILDGFRDLN
ncbi:hypothetical protein WOLCODRAFT_154242 [Wolfiporia cocos MD-104 SS10]|uniref:Uncharacterized protein n=1 Tax=Wolfiporia cocos (strain MD-104) TaxID=742152 RepID=A0A2H3JPW7_WOLCO|nr:hypothetical protein WOLCODRAFT_154242 [Wolfiporia cocos MD-104 SS10]